VAAVMSEVEGFGLRVVVPVLRPHKRAQNSRQSSSRPTECKTELPTETKPSIVQRKRQDETEKQLLLVSSIPDWPILL
jgi:hypothetical protein